MSNPIYKSPSSHLYDSPSIENVMHKQIIKKKNKSNKEEG